MAIASPWRLAITRAMQAVGPWPLVPASYLTPGPWPLLAVCGKPLREQRHSRARGLTCADVGGVRGARRENVLNTDVTTTMPAAKDFEKRGRRPSATVLDFDAAAEAAKNGGGSERGPGSAQVFCMIIKAADISNPSRPLPLYQRWIEGIMQEFFAQGDAEREKGMTISMNCDRSSVVVAKAQVF